MSRGPKKAYRDIDFLTSKAARTIRILSEYVEPETRFAREEIDQVVCFFGSARALSATEAQANLEGGKAGNADAKELERLEMAVKLSRYYEDARALATLLTSWAKEVGKDGRTEKLREPFVLCSGGGPGIMEATNRGAAAIDGFCQRPGAAMIAAMNQWLRLALDLGPLLIFFSVNARAGLLTATGAFMAAIVVSLAVTYWIERRVPRVPLVLAAFVLVFGGLTLALGDETFIKIKPTAINALFAVVLFASLGLRRNLLKVAFREAFSLDDAGWRVLTWRWASFFAAMAVLNEAMWRTQTTDIWVSFKVFGILPLTLAFALLQVPFLHPRPPARGGQGGVGTPYPRLSSRKAAAAAISAHRRSRRATASASAPHFSIW